MPEPAMTPDEEINAVITSISDSLFDIKECVEWLEGRSVGAYYGNPIDREKLIRGYYAAVQGIQDMQDALPPHRVKSTGTIAGFTFKIPPKWYTFVEQNFLCSECRRRAGIVLTTEARFDVTPAQGPSILQVTVGKEQMSNRVLCYECLRELSARTGLPESRLFYKMRPFTYLIRGAWHLFGLFGLILSILAILFGVCN